MRKLNKKHISETGYYQIFCWNLFKYDRVASRFLDYCCSSLEKENTLAIKMRKQITEAPTERSSTNLGLTAIIKIIKNFCEGVKFSEKLKWALL